MRMMFDLVRNSGERRYGARFRIVVASISFLVFAVPLRADRIVRSDALELSLSGADDLAGSRATRIRNRETGADWLEAPTPLFRLAGDEGLTGRLAVDTAPGGELRLRLTVMNPSSRSARAAPSFPVLRGLGVEESRRVGYCFPRSGAVIGREPVELRAPYGGLFPLQFLAVFHARAGTLYTRTEDLELHEKTYWLRKEPDGRVDLGVDHAPRMLGAGESWTLPPAVLGVAAGDWHAAFDAYRGWVGTWYRPLAPRKRWFREAFSFRQISLHPDAGSPRGALDPAMRRDRLADLLREDAAAFGGLDFVHLVDGSPERGQGRVEELRSEIEELRADPGPGVGIHFEGYLAPKSSAVAKSHGEAWQISREDGKPHDRSGEAGYCMCPGVEAWRTHLAHAMEDAVATLDVQGACLGGYGLGHRYPCHRDDHGHGVPSSPLAGEHAMLSACRSVLPPEKALYTEETPADVSTQLVDGSSTRALSSGEHAGRPAVLDLARFAFPDFKTFAILPGDGPAGDGLEGARRAFFNGAGIWLAGESSRASRYSLETRRAIARARRILRTHRGAFCSSHPEPDVPTLQRDLHANRFSGRSEVIWTLFNASDADRRGEVLSVEHFDGARYRDLWKGRELAPRIDGDRAYLSQEIPPGGVACIRRTDERGVARIEALGGIVFRQSGRIVEVKLDRSRVADSDLELLAGLAGVTDLSLEQTAVGDAGLARLEGLHELEWLNLYRTRVGDAGLAHLKPLGELRHLPLGETRVTDAGLAHLEVHTRLVYLGLRGNAITDAGLTQLRAFPRLEGLHLGETRVTDRGLGHLRGLKRLKKLWLHDTAITDAAIPVLLELSSLEELQVQRTGLSAGAARRLREGLPGCRVVSEAP